MSELCISDVWTIFCNFHHSLISLENLKIIIIKNISEMHCQQIQLLHKLVWIGFAKLPTPPMMCVCVKRLHKQMEPMICGWTLILSIWSLGQYHRCIEQEATALLSSRQVFHGISELAPPVFSPLKCTRLFFHWMLKQWLDFFIFIHECATTGAGYLTDLVYKP